MKRILYFITVLTLIAMLFCPIVVSAEELTEEPTEEVVTETPEEVVPEEVVPEVTEEEPNIFTRLYEAFLGNKTDIYTIGGSLVLLVLSLILRKDLGNSSKSLVSSIATVLSKTDLSAERQEAIVGGLNEMIDGYEDIKKQSDYVKEKMSEFVEVINEVSKSNAGLETKLADTYNGVVTLIEKLVLQNAEIMDVLDSVYVNNRALSQGVKDFVALKHSENGKLVQETISFIHKDGESV
jgi:hypothetical protein